jgi:hypothetical protein
MADVTADRDAEHAQALGRRYLIRFEEDTLRQRPLWIRLIIEFLGTFVLVTVAAGAGVINHYAGGNSISRTAAVIAPGAVVMAMIYAWGPLSGLHINPAVTFGFTACGVFPPKWVVPYWVVQFAGAICAALFLQLMFGDVSAGGNYPISSPGGEWKSLVMEIVLTTILASVILNTATGGPQHRPQRRDRGRLDGGAAGAVRQPDQRRLDEPGPLARPRHRQHRFHRLVGLCGRPSGRRRHRRRHHRPRARATRPVGAGGRRRRRTADDRPRQLAAADRRSARIVQWLHQQTPPSRAPRMRRARWPCCAAGAI